jgi:putative RecB family exonuclease
MIDLGSFRNTHLSYSRLARFEQCPLSFKLHYIDRIEGIPGPALLFGKAVHAVLERLLGDVITDERTGVLSEDRALELFAKAWASQGLSGVTLFKEGRELLRRFVLDQGVVDHRDVLAVEKQFCLDVGPFTLLGYIDRVERIGGIKTFVKHKKQSLNYA